MRYLDERKIGFKIAGTQVPIVPAAILMDLGFGGKPEVRPGPDCGYRAATAATADAVGRRQRRRRRRRDGGQAR